jgi:DNA replicative helicase MCM subunit Mcm2 (Cdc46/Mcm family)
MLHGNFGAIPGFSTESDEYLVYKAFLEQYLDQHHAAERESNNYLVIDIDALCGDEYPMELNLYDNLIENQKEFHTILENVVLDWCGNNRDIFYQPPEKFKVEFTSPDKLTHHKIDKLLRFRGVVDSFRPFFVKPYLFHYQCRCSNKITLTFKSTEIIKCKNDGWKMKLSGVENYSLMYFHLQIPIENNPFAIIKCYFIVKERKYEKFLFDAKNIGEEVDILAIPRLIPAIIDGEQVSTIALELKGFALLRQRKITPEREKEIIDTIRAMPPRTAIERLCNSICPHIYRNDYVKILALAVAVGLDKPDKDLGEHQNTALNVLLIGDASVGKTKTVKPFIKYFNRSMFMTGRGTTYVGLLGGAEKVQGGGFIMRIGQIVKSDKSFIIMDELDKIEENTLKGLYTGMSEGTHHASNITGGATFTYNTSFIMCANPLEGKFDPQNKKLSKISFKADFLSRIHIATIVDKAYEVDGKYEETMHDEYLSLRLGLKKQEAYFDEDFLMDYAVLVRQFANPKETTEVRKLDMQYVKEKTAQVKAVSQDDFDTVANLDKKTVDERYLDCIRILQKRIAKAVFSSVIGLEHFTITKDILEIAMIRNLMRHNLTPITLQEHITEAEKTKIPHSDKDKYYAILDMIPESTSSPGLITWIDLIKKATDVGINEREVETVLEKLSHKGEITVVNHDSYQRLG